MLTFLTRKECFIIRSMVNIVPLVRPIFVLKFLKSITGIPFFSCKGNGGQAW